MNFLSHYLSKKPLQNRVIIIFPHITAAPCVAWSVPSVARSGGWLEEARWGRAAVGRIGEMMMKSILDIPRGPLELQTNLREESTITEKAPHLQSSI